MRSPGQKIRQALLLTLMVSLGFGCSGCQVGRTFFQMDSNSPVPFFGMDLLPQRNKKSATDGVSRFQSEAEPANDAPIALSESQSPPRASRGWGRLLGQPPQTETLTLPATKTAESPGISDHAPVEQFR
ncbi:MAG: hypothetical protein AB7I48_16400 [Planctomycetaceae bacterium]